MKPRLFLIVFILSLFCETEKNYAQWTSMNGPYHAGIIECLQPLGDKIFVSTEDRGVFSSLDYGLSWNNVTGIKDITSFFAWGNFLFAGSGMEGIFQSLDNGITWINIQDTFKPDLVNRITFNGKRLYVGANDGLYFSPDTGKSWSKISQSSIFGLASKDNYILANHDSNNYSDGMIFSSDGGINWNVIDTGLTRKTIYSFAFSRDIIFAAGGCGKAIMSINNGKIWCEIDSGLPCGSIWTSYAVDGKYFVIDEGQIYYTPNFGKYWIDYSTGLYNKYAAVSISSSDSDLFVGTRDSGVWKRSLKDFKDIEWDRVIQKMGLDSLVSNAQIVRVFLINLTPESFSISVTLTGQDSSEFEIFSQQPKTLSGFTIPANDSVWFDILFKPDLQKPYPGRYSERHAYLNASILDKSTKSIQFIGTWSESSAKVPILLSDLIIFPNPTNSVLSIHNAPDNLTSIPLLNVLGEKVMEVASPHSSDFTIDLSLLPSGMYYARFATPNSVEVREIIKE
jgi:photosystem II stability/assembly factor-like uncharacterized protein